MVRSGAALAILFAALSSPVSAQTRVDAIKERLEHANQWRDHVMVVAHRGGGLQAGKSRFPENSAAAVEDAIALGAEMIEIDVQKSKDGVYVVLHDSWLDRTTTCKGELVERSMTELASCRLVVEGTGVATAETVPTLADMFAVTKDRILVNIDNKLDPGELPGIVAVARGMGMADQLVIKQNLWNAEKVAEARRIVEAAGPGVTFMPIIADDAVRETAFLESATRAVSANAVELIHWREAGQPMTGDGGPLFGARARAVAARGDWHLWVNTYAIVNRTGGMLSGGRGDELAVAAGFPEQSYGFWVDRGATMIQTDEPAAAIGWLTENGYRRPYGGEEASARHASADVADGERNQ
ncbi:glycerophosphoryl diester phosphodiesterase [Mesorhizobium sp. L-8-10]|uniref:glycerophosphodiester phosphodiesterase family protein n=1 Tax=Mesorhizobium sp. L-8-10 TaxID=2744523 RepID=UPI00192536E4|nr:glycerophosphodiester phosphodiesterase family protein [Mesorhizobium sp. L-8-10]BCH33669.1 glycerophosphoryl diester phosphodiesterase [Mesorhizobium sp. L-8-10]